MDKSYAYTWQAIGVRAYAHPFYLEPIDGSSSERSVKHPHRVPCQIIGRWGDDVAWIVRFDADIKGAWKNDQMMFRGELSLLG